MIQKKLYSSPVSRVVTVKPISFIMTSNSELLEIDTSKAKDSDYVYFGSRRSKNSWDDDEE